MTGLFDGPAGWLVGKIMAKQNAEAEREAVARLDPAPDYHVLVVGFGPGVGLAWLAARSPGIRITGIDPSRAMNAAAARRNRRIVRSGQLTLLRADLAGFQAEPATFDGAIAVNTLQLCQPLSDAARKLGEVLRPGARLVTITHNWAMAHHAGSVDAFLDEARRAFASEGFSSIRSGSAQAEGGKAVVFGAVR